MVKLIQIEFRKHFLKTSIVVAVLLFSILNIVKIYSVYDGNSLLSKNHSDPKWKSLYWKMYEDFGGEITEDKTGMLLSIYRPLEEKIADLTASTATDNPNTYTGNVYSDTYFFGWCFVDPMKYCYQYKSYADGIVVAAKDNIEFYKSYGNTYEYRKNVVIANLFHGREISDFSYMEMYQYYVHYDFSWFLVLLICLYGLVGVFVLEKETEMDTLILTTKAGGSKTVLAKIFSSVIFVCVICCWFWLVDFAAFSAFFGSLEAAEIPLYGIENFTNASINVNLGQYVILSSFVKTVGMLVIGMASLLLSCIFKNTLLPFIISLSGTILLVYIQELSMGSGHVLLKVINPFVLIVNRELFRKTEFVNLFNFPVLSYILALFFAVAWGAGLVVGIAILVRKNTNCKRRRGRVIN
jgi:hypothetical protein